MLATMVGNHPGRMDRLGKRTTCLVGVCVMMPWLVVLVIGCAGVPTAARDGAATTKLSSEQEDFLDVLERDTFAYFWDTTPLGTGLTPDRFPGDDVASVAAVGFALSSYPVGVERHWISRQQAVDRTLTTLRFLWQARQGPEAEGVAGYKGFFYHFLDGKTGLRARRSELSTIDTTLLMAGALSAEAYFNRSDAGEAEIRKLASALYERVDWPWAYSRRHPPLLSMGWTPEHGAISNDWEGYSEAMILYLLALGAPTHPIGEQAWEKWTSTYHWEVLYGFPHVSFAPLFGHQYSHVWIDFRGIRDKYMREKGIDYFINSVRATAANQAYCMDNPAKWSGYSKSVWGLTASDGPLKMPALDGGKPSPFRAYWARGATSQFSNDDGTIAPTAAGGSMPFAPQLAINTLLYFRSQFGERLYGRYGFKDAFNLSFPTSSPAVKGWFDDQYVAIDQGPILLMSENFRTGLLWDLMRRHPAIQTGLLRAGFTGGWLTPLQGQLASKTLRNR